VRVRFCLARSRSVASRPHNQLAFLNEALSRGCCPSGCLRQGCSVRLPASGPFGRIWRSRYVGASQHLHSRPVPAGTGSVFRKSDFLWRRAVRLGGGVFAADFGKISREGRQARGESARQVFSGHLRKNDLRKSANLRINPTSMSLRLSRADDVAVVPPGINGWCDLGYSVLHLLLQMIAKIREESRMSCWSD